jgi:2-polyprenyl-3-methyl-5-hydroxy-6-metoxy-1,4-benzoquinol methylase/predicted nucleotidyltransferase
MTMIDHADRELTLKQAASAAVEIYAAGAERVLLCGSLAHGNHWDHRSDIDYATIGLPPSRGPDLTAALVARLQRRVDIVCLEEAPSWLRTQITLEMLPVERNGRLARPSAVKPRIPVARPQDAPYPRELQGQRHATAADQLHRLGAGRVLDIGCGEGEFEATFVRRWPHADTRIHGIDPDSGAIAAAHERLNRELEEHMRRRVHIEIASLAEAESLWSDHDAISAIEVIEHLDASALDNFAELVFARLRPAFVVLTTPNAEFNVLFPTMPGTTIMRRPEHRFERTREQMRQWLRDTACASGYRVALRGVGESHPECGSPTQLWTLEREG